MGINDIPLKSAEARKLAERDAEVLNGANPPGFRFERTQLRFQVALRNGLSQREAERLEQLAQPPSRAAQWLRSLRRSWASARLGWAAGVLTAASATLVVWATMGESSDGIAQSPATTLELVAGIQATRHDFADGSAIVLAPGARGRLEQQGQSVHFDLEHGLALFDVTHVPGRATDPDRQWRVSAGDYEVTVIGTTFSVRFDAVAGFEVEVQRGAVAVRVPDQDSSLQVNTGELLTATSDAVTLRHPDRRGTIAHAEVQAGRDGSTELAAKTQGADESAAGSSTAAGSLENAGPVAARSKTGASRGGKQSTATSDDAIAGPPANLNRSLAASTPPQEREELTLLSRARQALAAGQPSRALSWIDVHGRRFARGQLSEEREALRVEALRHVGRDEEARRAAGEFKKRFPKSVLTKQMPADAP